MKFEYPVSVYARLNFMVGSDVELSPKQVREMALNELYEDEEHGQNVDELISCIVLPDKSTLVVK